MEHDTDLIHSKPIPAIVDVRNRILGLVNEIMVRREEIDMLAQTTVGDTIWSQIENRGHFDDKFAREIVDKKFWHFIVESSQLSRAMSEKAKSDLYQKIEKAPPEFSLAEVEMYSANLQNLYAENGIQTIKEIYRALIGCKYHGSGNWGNWKEDNLREVKPSFRCAWGIRWDAFFGQFRSDSWYGQGCKYEDLLTACYLLDSGIRPDYDVTFKALSNTQFKSGCEVVTPYFTVTAFKNGNQSVKWATGKLDVLRLLNKYGSDGTRLPDHLSKKYKPEHFV